MEAVKKLEIAAAEQYKKAPHLPVNGQKWLATNAWWLVLIGVVLSVFGLFGLASVLLLALFGLSLGGAAIGSTYGAAAGVALGGVLLVSTFVSLALYVIEVILLGMAVSPLKAMKKRGWDLVFLVTVLNALVVIVTNVLAMNLVSLVFGLLWVVVGAYFLFEVRERFGTAKAAVKPAKAAVKAKA